MCVCVWVRTSHLYSVDILLHLVVDLRHQDERRHLLKTVAESDEKRNKIVGATWVSCVVQPHLVFQLLVRFPALRARLHSLIVVTSDASINC